MQLSARSRWIMIGAALGVLVLAIFLGRKVLGPRVESAEVTSGPLVRLVVVSGRVRSPGTATLSSLVAGRVLEVPVEEGEEVKKGDLLVAIEDSQLRAEQLRSAGALARAKAQLSQVRTVGSPAAEASLDQAEADLERERSNYERVKMLAQGGAVAANQLDAARSAFEVARARAASARLQVSSNRPGGPERALVQADVVQAEAALLAADSQLERARILAPSDGTLLRRIVEPGDSVQPGTEVVVLARRGPIELEADPDERSLAQLKPGQVARVSADAFPRASFEATLRFIAPAVDPERGTVTVRFDVPEPPDYLRPDMTISISVVTGRAEDALMIPTGSLRDADSERPWVLAVRDGRATRVDVTPGLEGQGVVQIVRGLKAGERVIPPTVSAREGERVRPRS